MLNSDDMFRAKAMESRRKEIAALETKLNNTERHNKVRAQAVEIIHKKGDLTEETKAKFTMPEIKALLGWKLGKLTGKKADLIQRYIETPRPSKRTNTFFFFTSKKIENIP